MEPSHTCSKLVLKLRQEFRTLSRVMELQRERKLRPVCCLLPLLLLFLLTLCSSGETATQKVRLCLQPAQSGRCFGYVPSYAYNPYERKCEPFVYGGCGGNANRFETKAECEYNCRDV